MKISVYLNDEICSKIAYFGTLDDVVNRMLNDMVAHDELFDDKPEPPPRTKDKRKSVDVLCSEYLELFSHYPPNSSKVSLRRLIYWFFGDYEVYATYGWKKDDTPKTSHDECYNRAYEALRFYFRTLGGLGLEEQDAIIKSLLKLRRMQDGREQPE